MITLTKKGRIITIIMAALTVMTAALVGIIYLMPNKHTLLIRNYASEDVTITQINLNGKSMSTSNVLLIAKQSKEREGGVGKEKLEMSFRAFGKSALNLHIKRRGEKESQISCSLEDRYGIGCIFYAKIKNANRVACYCDPIDIE